MRPLSKEQELLILCARLNQTPEVSLRIEQILAEGVNWGLVNYYSMRHRLSPLLYRNLCCGPSSAKLPASISQEWRAAYTGLSIRNIKILARLKTILRVFEERKVEPVVLKGGILSWWLYEDIGLRFLCDLDLFVKADDLAEVGFALKGMGYEQREKFQSFQSDIHDHMAELHADHLPSFYRKGWPPVELHVELFDRVPEGVAELDLVWKTAVPYKAAGISALGLSLEYQILFTAFHLYKHARSGNITLYRPCDLHELICKGGKVLNWESLCGRAVAMEIEQEVRAVLSLLAGVWQSPIPEKVWQQLGEQLENLDWWPLFDSWGETGAIL